jgi:predicted dehydrogenase
MGEHRFDESGFGSISASSPDVADALRRALVTPPVDRSIPIGLVGAGWIGGLQLDAYRDAGFVVSAVLDRHPERAAARASRAFPDARVFSELGAFLSHPGLRIVDVATHTADRPVLLEAAIDSGHHVLSQKPFVEDTRIGSAIQDRADSAGVHLAVNQNGRWAPHFAAALAVVRAGLIGEVVSADFSVAWPHDRVVADKPAFASMEDLVLYDFGAHWFDLIGVLAPRVPLSVFASAGRRPGQAIAAPVQAQAVVTGDGFASTLAFRGGEPFGDLGEYRISGTRGAVEHRGRSLGGDTVSVETVDGNATVAISDDWFRYGLAGSMRALLGAVSDGRPLENSAASALRGLDVCFAALQSARSGASVVAGSVHTRSGPSADGA